MLRIAENQNVNACGDEMFEQERKNRTTSGGGGRASYRTIQRRLWARVVLHCFSMPTRVNGEGEKCWPLSK